MRSALLLLVIPALAGAQNLQNVLKQGEQIFNQTCAAGYCHGPKGSGGGAPRLSGRGFDQAYINNTVMRGVPGTAMAAYGMSLSRAELTAVVAYVATLNGIANPSLNAGRGRGGPAPAPEGPVLTGEAARGRDLFSDALRGFGRCSTCHEVAGIGIPVATPIATVPADAAALRGLATPSVSTVTADGQSMPGLVVAKKSQTATFYDLTVPPPVLRTVEPSQMKTANGSTWKHSSVLGSYNDAELGAILAYLRAEVKQ